MSRTCLLSELSSSSALCHSWPLQFRASFSQRRPGRVRWPSPKRISCAPVVNVSSHFQLIPPPYPMTWNHDFFWQSMKPGGGGRPSGILLQLIERDFGSFELFLKEFKAAALTQFGSGWVWLSYKANKLDAGNAVNPLPSTEDNKLVVSKTPNAVNPLVWDYSPLLSIDVWEHAYYLDYECKLCEYISVFMDKLVSWDAASSRLELAITKAEERARKDARGTEENENAD